MLVRNRTPKFLSGRAFTAQEIQDIQETIETCGLPWTELVYTVCEHLDWVTPTGRYKEKSCISALRKLEALRLSCWQLQQSQGFQHDYLARGRRTRSVAAVVGTARE